MHSVADYSELNRNKKKRTQTLEEMRESRVGMELSEGGLSQMYAAGYGPGQVKLL